MPVARGPVNTGTVGSGTSEREDAAWAVDLLVRETGYQDLRADAQGWFDAVRSF